MLGLDQFGPGRLYIVVDEGNGFRPLHCFSPPPLKRVSYFLLNFYEFWHARLHWYVMVY
jgi:hypothetical protein